jgi:hypothetical protein
MTPFHLSHCCARYNDLSSAFKSPKKNNNICQNTVKQETTTLSATTNSTMMARPRMSQTKHQNALLLTGKYELEDVDERIVCTFVIQRPTNKQVNRTDLENYGTNKMHQSDVSFVATRETFALPVTRIAYRKESMGRHNVVHAGKQIRRRRLQRWFVCWLLLQCVK